MSGRPDSDQEPLDTPAEKAPTSLSDIPLADRWAPLVRDPEHPTPPPPKYGQRVLAAALSLIVLALFLWAIS